MINKFIRHFPVIDENQHIVGIVSIGDIVKELISEQEFLINRLVSYISGETPKPAIPEKLENI